MPIEINQLTVRAQVLEELRDTPCGTNPNATNRRNNNRHEGTSPSQRTTTRQAVESASEILKRQKER